MNKKHVIIFIIIFLLIIFGFYLNYENTQLEVTSYDIYNKKIPNDFNNYKIIQISDFHNSKSKKLSESLVTEIKNQHPNIIAITGDFIDSTKINIDIAINFIISIKDIAPIYFVSGNHESSINNYLEFKNMLKDNNVIILDNKSEVLKINESKINLIGIDDPHMAHESAVSDSEIIKAELKNCNFNNNNYSILLSHRPELFDTYANEEIDLVFSGHAHGGQIRLPFLGGIIAPNQGFFPEYTSGLFTKSETTMIVSRGIGNSIFPFRINNRPELVVVTIKSN